MRNAKILKKIIVLSLSLLLLLSSQSQNNIHQSTPSAAIITVKTAVPIPITTVADPVNN